MTVDEFLAWTPPEGDVWHRELLDGVVVEAQVATVGHGRITYAAMSSLDASLKATGTQGEVIAHSVGVRINSHTMLVSDVLVHCGAPLPGDSMEASAPVIIVEVICPLTDGIDSQQKLIEYFQLENVRHYVIVLRDLRKVVHHARREDGLILTTIHAGKPITLDPPGLILSDLFRDEDGQSAA